MTNQTKLAEYNMENELYDLRSIFLLMVKGGLDKQTRDKIGIFLAHYMQKKIQSRHQFFEHQGFGPAYTSEIIILPRWRVQDIDNEQDWRNAELIMETITNQNSKR